MNLKQEYGLPNKLKGKSFADASKIIEKTFKNRMSNADIRTKQELMSRLKDVQEIQRQEMEQDNQMQYGGYDGESYVEDKSQLHTDEIFNNKIDTRNWLGRTFGSEGTIQNWLNKNEGENKQNVLGGIGLAASALGPLIANRQAVKNLKKPELESAYTMDKMRQQPEFVNRQQLLRNAAQQSSSQMYNINQLGSNLAQRSAMLANLNANRLSSTGNIMLQSDLADIAEKQRVSGIRSNIEQFNIGQRQRTEDINAQNQAAYYNQLATYKQAQGANIGAIGQSLFNTMQANKYAKYMGQAGILQKI